MTKRVIVYGSPSWSQYRTRPISREIGGLTREFSYLWPATHALYCDTATTAGQIAYDMAKRNEFRAYELEPRHFLAVEFDLELAFLIEGDEMPYYHGTTRAKNRIHHIVRRKGED